jgi:hypothetical protein
MLQEYVQGYQKSPSPWSIRAVPDPREDGLGYSERAERENESERESARARECSFSEHYSTVDKAPYGRTIDLI